MLFSTLISCAMEINESSGGSKEKRYETPSDFSNPQTKGRLLCQNGGLSDSRCLSRQSWNTNCAGGACYTQEIAFFNDVPFTNLGERVVFLDIYEDVDLENLVGRQIFPSLFLENAGTQQKEVFFLAEGDYFVKAYSATPDQLGSISSKLTIREVFSLNGDDVQVASPVHKVSVGNGEHTKPVRLQLMRQESEPRAVEHTKIHFKLHLDRAGSVDKDRWIRFELFEGEDFSHTPVRSFQLSTDLLSVEGREGYASFLTPDLIPGSYYLRVFVDSNGNGLLDESELRTAFELDGYPVPLEVGHHQVKSVNLRLGRSREELEE